MAEAITLQEHFASRSDEELQNEAIGLHSTIFEVECFGTKDLMLYDATIAELERRGYRAGLTLGFVKAENDPEEE